MPDSAGANFVQVCTCDPFAEPDEQLDPNCPIHGKPQETEVAYTTSAAASPDTPRPTSTSNKAEMQDRPLGVVDFSARPSSETIERLVEDFGKAVLAHHTRADDCYHLVSADECNFTRAARSSLLEATEKLERERKAIEGLYTAMCDKLQACVQRFHLGLGGEHVDDLVVEEVARLRSENERLTEQRDVARRMAESFAGEMDV